MRLRNVKGSQEKILENPYTIQTDGTNGEDYKGLWNKNIFKNDNPIHIEIGMGKGQFIMGLAAENPDINYIGIEKYSSVLVRALDKRESLETDNLMFLRMDAEDIAEYFAPGEVSRIYLNFSDPCPKYFLQCASCSVAFFCLAAPAMLFRQGGHRRQNALCPCGQRLWWVR